MVLYGISHSDKLCGTLDRFSVRIWCILTIIPSYNIIVMQWNNITCSLWVWLQAVSVSFASDHMATVASPLYCITSTAGILRHNIYYTCRSITYWTTVTNSLHLSVPLLLATWKQTTHWMSIYHFTSLYTLLFIQLYTLILFLKQVCMIYTELHVHWPCTSEKFRE